MIAIIANWGTICDWFSEKWSQFTTWLGDKWEAFSSWFSEKADAFVKFWKELPGNIWGWISSLPKKIWNWGTEIITNLKESISNKINQIRQTFDNIVNTIADKIGGLPGRALRWGKDMIDNFIDGIASKVDSLFGWVGDIAGGIADFLGFSVPEKGPMSDADKWMPDMMDLLSSGIKNNKQKVLDEVYSLADMMRIDPSYANTSHMITESTTVVPVEVSLDGRVISRSASRTLPAESILNVPFMTEPSSAMKFRTVYSSPEGDVTSAA